MSKYTTEVRFICETSAGYDESQGYSNVNTIIANSRENIFDFDYPIFDENYRATLETKILKHYYTREIGLETVGLWKHFLDMRMNEIMPYYNKLYESELLEFDPFSDVDYTREGSRSGSEDTSETGGRVDTMTGTITDQGTNSNAMTGTVADQEGGTQGRSGSNAPKNSRWDLYSDTPQGGVAGIEAAEASVGSNAYLTNARHIIDDGTGSSENETTTFGKTDTRTYNTNNNGTDNNTRTYNTTNNGTDSKTGNTTSEGEYFESIQGKMGNKTYMKLLEELRETFLNIDTMIIEDLSDLFLNIY